MMITETSPTSSTDHDYSNHCSQETKNNDASLAEKEEPVGNDENPWAEALKQCADEYEKDNFDSDSEDDDPDLIYQDLELFLKAIDLSHLVDKLRAHKITLGQLLDFDEQDLVNCGIEFVGERKKILSNIGQLHAEKWVPTSLHDLTHKTLLTSPGIYIALNDINKHLEYIGVTFRYLRRHIRVKPHILELGRDYVGVHKIATELEDLLRTSKTTYIHLKALENQVQWVKNKPEYQPPNHVDYKYVRSAKLRSYIGPSLMLSIAVLVCYRIRRFLF